MNGTTTGSAAMVTRTSRIYVVTLPGVGTRIGLTGERAVDLRELGRRLRCDILTAAFEGRDVMLVDFSGWGRWKQEVAFWSERCGGRSVKRRDHLWTRPYFTVHMSRAGADCLGHVAREDTFATGELSVVAVSSSESDRHAEAVLLKRMQRAPWPVTEPRPIETIHMVDDALVAWWAHPSRLPDAEVMLRRFADDNGLGLDIEFAESHEQLVDRFFTGA